MTIYNFFVPNRQNIASITNANPGVVTTTQPHGYHDNLYVRLYYPVKFGMTQLLGQQLLIKVLSPTTFSIGVNTTSFDPFVIASTKQTPQVIPIGETAINTLINAVKNNNTDTPEL